MLAAVAAPVRARALALALVAAVCLASSATAQRGNFVDDGGFDYAEAAPPPRAAPRPAPAFRTVAAADTPRPTPVPILKQINRHNEDGSYTYGYEGADGAFKIETKLPTGEVMGKYGYVDDTGKVRVIEYGANKYGFQPAGEGITVAPPTLVDETATKKGGEREPVVFDDGQYYEEEPVRAAPAPRPVPRPVSRPAPRPAPRPAQQPQYAEDTFTSFQSSQNFGPSSRAATAPAFQPSSRAAAAPAFQPSSRPAPTPPQFEVPGAIQVGPAPSFSQPRAAPRPQSYFSPAPVRAAAPAPVYESAPVPVARPQPSRGAYGRSSGILDQLEKDFALPSNSAPALHDITFGSF